MISQDGISFPNPTSSTSISGFLDEEDTTFLNPNPNPNPDNSSSTNNKRKRSLPGHPDPEAEVVALSPRSLMATNRFICEVCNKGFQREQNLQLHRRGHNLPWKLKQKAKEPVRKKVYICPEKSCVHHDAARALGDLTGIKKHFSRKHGEKKWKCDKCAKKYAVMSDWKAHSKICGTREYKCDCGTIFSRKDSFITHRAFCDALTEERMRATNINTAATMNPNFRLDMIGNSFMTSAPQSITGISPYSTSHRPEFMSFGSSPGTTDNSNSNSNSNNNNNNNSFDGVNKPRLPLWLDHQQMGLQGNGSSPFLGSSSGGRAGSVLPEFPTGNFDLFSPSIQGGGILKNEEDNGKPSYSQGLFSMYSSQVPQQQHQPLPLLQPLSSPTASCNMSATALLQKAAQIGSTRSENNSTVFTNTSLSSSSPMLSNNIHPGGFRQDATRGGQMMRMMGPGSGGMRDFLGSMGGNTRVDVSNDDGGSGENERRVALQEEMAYKLATMAAGAQQEPYMDLMR